ncbi:SDR family NAD(P)-dependent oxidoreductase [Sporosarcina sp. Sa2YVA2]|uniref:SDR family NAD(P)-dependent oxidoreductase n=1 Tax=Sporosarcina quadrami TaxID=2762234 RepID=A0ABR8U8K3_9BACL|nr:SDR family NAD(P)-dependent oxidoreductase [Sporosarcina quadrami]MBD7984361.1 SDR family NAD(P)-dependent oxidoreductase [Sporosarcina quadrami]
MNIYIITGASKGIGYEMLKQLRGHGERVIGVARTNPHELEDFIIADLSNTESVEQMTSQILTDNLSKASSFTLINNAGVVDPIGLIGSVNSLNMMEALAVNLAAPMIASNAFISNLKDFEGIKRIINISSGAGRSAYEGWGVYCTTKAGLDHFTRVVAIEQESAEYPVEVVAIAPGIIDTDMQEAIRSSDEDDFPLLGRFIDYKEQGHLSSAEETAHKLISFMDRKDFKELGPIADIRQI